MSAEKSDREKAIIHKKLDGELKKHETKVFQRKIKTDPALKVEYESLKKVTEATEKGVKPIQPSPNFKARVIKNLEDKNQ